MHSSIVYDTLYIISMLRGTQKYIYITLTFNPEDPFSSGSQIFFRDAHILQNELAMKNNKNNRV
jgi:hypothetical protein